MVNDALQLQGQEDLNKCSKVWKWNSLLMTAIGVWPTNPSNFLYFLNAGYLTFYMILEYLDLFLFIDDLEHVLMNLTENMAFSQILVRLYSMRIYKDHFKILISEANKDFNAKDYTDEERKAFVSNYVKCRTFLMLLLANTALTATSYYVKPLLGQMEAIIQYAGSNSKNASSFVFILPYRFYTFYELKDVSTYFWTYGSQLPFVFVSGFGQCSADCLMITMVYHVAGQMAVLALRITNIDTHPSQCTRDLQKVIKSHIRLLRMGKIIEESFSVILLTHLIGATLLVCILGYQILTVLASGEKAILISFFAFIFLVLLILYTICLAGENLIIQSNCVTEAYYNCKWYQMSKENARIFSLCINRSQKPLRLTAGKFCTCCLQTFTDTLKTSMGYLSVLRTVM